MTDEGVDVEYVGIEQKHTNNDDPPSKDIEAILDEIRSEYEGLNNKRFTEMVFLAGYHAAMDRDVLNVRIKTGKYLNDCDWFKGD